MTLFRTSEKQRASRNGIADAMKKSGLSNSFVDNWLWVAGYDAGVFELGELWLEESDSDERGELLLAISNVLREVGL